jgi:hypothetical protein
MYINGMVSSRKAAVPVEITPKRIATAMARRASAQNTGLLIVIVKLL